MADFIQKVKFWIEDYKLVKKFYGVGGGINISYTVRKAKYQKKYNFAHMEFFNYNLATKSEEEVYSFFPRNQQAKLYKAVNKGSSIALTLDKFASYLKLKQFYRRSACAYNPEPNESVKSFYEGYDWHKDVSEFLLNHTDFIVKPLGGDSGKGIRVIHDKTITEAEVDDVQRKLVHDYPAGFILEELVIQDKALAQFHPESVNTIRINTFKLNDGSVEIKFPCMRVGRGKSVVDNANSGGLIVAIDVNTGVTLASSDEQCNIYQRHPDTNCELIGVEIPMWNQLKCIATEVAQELDGLKICGMDFALSTEGWVLIEVNYQPLLIYQYATLKGIRPEVNEYMKRLSDESVKQLII